MLCTPINTTQITSGKIIPYSLTITDLIFIGNFKGSSATITEPMLTLNDKLEFYEDALEKGGPSSVW